MTNGMSDHTQLPLEVRSTPTSLSHPWCRNTKNSGIETFCDSWAFLKEQGRKEKNIKINLKINTIMKTCCLQVLGCLRVLILALPTLHSSRMLPPTISENYLKKTFLPFQLYIHQQSCLRLFLESKSFSSTLNSLLMKYVASSHFWKLSQKGFLFSKISLSLTKH